MVRAHIPRKYYLLVHDCIKKVERNATIHAFVSSRGKYQSDMVVQLDRKQFPNLGPDNTHAIAEALQKHMSYVLLKPQRHCIDLEFPVNEIQMSVQIGWKDVTIEEINSEPEYEDRVPLRTSFGYDEQRFMNSAPKLASLSAVLLEKWALKNYGKEMAPPAMYWLVHSYRVMEAYPAFDHHQIIFGSVADKFSELYGKYPLDNPFCPGEDLNTLRLARNICLGTNPQWSEPPELRKLKPVMGGGAA
jgi:hypothetical protein